MIMAYMPLWCRCEMRVAGAVLVWKSATAGTKWA